MYRSKISSLVEWKNNPNRMPLILYGARQVGKTWLAIEFAKCEFPGNYVYINFEEADELQNVFEGDFNTDRILNAISMVCGVKVNNDTLLIFDELQAVRRGITSLKYFCENRRSQPIIAAGSLLGISVHPGDSFPVGKVESLYIYPLDFSEFLLATGRELMMESIENADWSVLASVHKRLSEALKEYYFVGGMPSAVTAFVEKRDYDAVRKVQLEILDNYDRDMSKHAADLLLSRVRDVWRSLPAQLSQENKKFVFSLIKSGARARSYEDAITWLVDAGLAAKVIRNTKPELPLIMFEDSGAFKLYANDIGLLCAMCRISAKTLLNGNELFAQAKGAITEQFVFQELRAAGYLDIYYWSADKSQCEVDFIVQSDDKVLPIEVKAEENLRSKSLAAFIKRYPALRGIRLSLSNYRKQDWMANYPLYALRRALMSE